VENAVLAVVLVVKLNLKFKYILVISIQVIYFIHLVYYYVNFFLAEKKSTNKGIIVWYFGN
jgi:hypothetical protein